MDGLVFAALLEPRRCLGSVPEINEQLGAFRTGRLDYIALRYLFVRHVRRPRIPSCCLSGGRAGHQSLRRPHREPAGETAATLSISTFPTIDMTANQPRHPSHKQACHVCVFVGVHFNDQSVVRRFIEHIGSLRWPIGLRVELCIADNSLNWEGESPEWVTVVRPSGNLGYLNGCAFALNEWRKRNGEVRPTIAIVGNTDLQFHPTFLERLSDTRDPSPKHVGIGVLAPDIRTPDGRSLNPYSIKPWSNRQFRLRVTLISNSVTYWLMNRTLLLRSRVREITRQLFRGQNQPPGRHASFDIYAAHGSCFILGPTFFYRSGSLAYPGFLYGEELYIAEECAAKGIAITYEPALEVLHEGRGMERRANARARRTWAVISMKAVWNTYRGEF